MDQRGAEEYIIGKYGFLMTPAQLANVLDRSEQGLLKSSREPGNPLASAKVKVGRRVYFRADKIAKIIVGG